MRFDVVFTRSSVFAEVSVLEKSISSRVSIYLECSLLGGFDFGKVSNVNFCLMSF